MRIGIAGPFNPAFVTEFLDEEIVPSINNTATAVNTLVREMLIQGHNVVVFTLIDEAKCKRIIKGQHIVIHLIPSGLFPKILGRHQFLIGQLYLPYRISKEIGNGLNQVDVLHAHWTYEYAMAVKPYSKVLPVYVTVRDWCPLQLKLQKSIIHKIEWNLKYYSFKKVMCNNRINFIANSGYTYRKIKELIPTKDIPIILNPIDKSWIITEKKRNIPHQIISIASSIFEPRKNIIMLLKAFVLYKNKYSDAKLHLVGSFEKKNETYILWNQNRLLESVVLHGQLDHKKLCELLDDMSILVHPSIEETFGNILLEAMSRQIPCIGGESAGAVPEVLGQGKYGMLCDITSPDEIFKKMDMLSDPEVALKYQKQAGEMLKQQYASDVIISKHIQIYQSKHA